MKRNFGSLNLAALNISADSSSLEDQFSAMNPGSEDYRMDGSEHGSDENVGFPLESMDQPTVSMEAASQLLPDEEFPQDLDMEMEDVMPELELPARRLHSNNVDVRTSRLMPPSSSSESPQHLHDQHVELNALRCLSLKVMLSNLSTSNSSANVTVASKPNYAYPGVNDHAKTALRPIRQPSLQSV